MPTVNQYEVEIKIGKKSGGGERLIVVTEHAYSVMDAMNQSIISAFGQMMPGEEFKLVTRIGPPAELVQASAFAITQAIEDAMRVITTKGKK